MKSFGDLYANFLYSGFNGGTMEVCEGPDYLLLYSYEQYLEKFWL